MKKVIALEGVDGSGKGFVVSVMQKYAEARNIEFFLVDKQVGPVSEYLTNLIQAKEASAGAERDYWDGYPSIIGRLARDWMRAIYAQRVTSGIVVIDRFLLTTRSYASSLSNNDLRFMSGVDSFVGSIEDASGLTNVLFCEVPFDVAWQRVLSRAAEGVRPLSRKESKGAVYAKSLGDLLQGGYDARILRCSHNTIGTNCDRSETEAATVKYLDSILRDN